MKIYDFGIFGKWSKETILLNCELAPPYGITPLVSLPLMVRNKYTEQCTKRAELAKKKIGNPTISMLVYLINGYNEFEKTENDYHRFEEVAFNLLTKK